MVLYNTEIEMEERNRATKGLLLTGSKRLNRFILVSDMFYKTVL